MARDKKAPVNFTKTAIDALPIPATGREEWRDGGGKDSVNGLSLRITSNGNRSWCVFRRVKGGQPVRITLGGYPELTPTIARALALEHMGKLAQRIAPVKAVSVKAKAEAIRERKRHTLAALAMAYVDFQQSRGRSSYSDARSIFNLHLIERAPALANKPAADVQTEEITDLLRAVKESGKDRTANKLRSYLRAAYAIAMASVNSHEYPVTFKAFAIKRNPVAGTIADRSANKADKNPLALSELRAYWRAIENAPGIEGAMLRLHLLTGGQRIEQLARLRAQDVGDDSIKLNDTKGRGQVARAHVVPLTARARAALDELNTDREYLVSRSGTKPIDPTGLSRIAQKVAAIEGFQLKRVRSGVETLLASRGVSKETRGRLQSHGVTGVQDTHYNAHDYMPEKLGALELLDAALNGTEAKVIAIRAA